ncbi:MAG: SDR family oxidoreductase [Deltaproteobacteria bacterium]|nr:SDR family oxidoreductase [Deltaproteobacteria bacterium]MBW2306506.1 SDR family oxidoreductase [Deltaproteobacteria bacterium]
MSNSVLVTGASTGLGLEIALYLAERGFEVYASMRDLRRRAGMDKAAAHREIQLHVLQLDIRKKNEIDKAMRTVVERSGGIYALVNNAGIGLRGYFEDLSEEEIRSVFETNVFGTMAMTRAVLPHMRAAKQGRIVFVTSVGGLIGSLAVSAYCATKFAQEGFGESLAQELVPFGIHVSLVEPAIIKTERWGANRAVARGALNPQSPYHAWFRGSESLADHLVETSPTKPVDVARAVHRALIARRPSLRYMVGRRASLVMMLRRYLPGGLFERLYFGEAVRRVTKTGQRMAQ